MFLTVSHSYFQEWPKPISNLKCKAHGVSRLNALFPPIQKHRYIYIHHYTPHNMYISIWNGMRYKRNFEAQPVVPGKCYTCFY